MALLLFGIPPQVPASSVLAACADLGEAERVVVERNVAASRKWRWLMLSGTEAKQAHAALAALTQAAGSLLVVVEDDDTWRIMVLELAGGAPRYVFDDVGYGVRDEKPETTLRARLRERTTAADAEAINQGESWFGASRWDHYVRSSNASPPFVATTVVPDDLPYALDPIEVYDWSESEGRGANGAPPVTPEHLRADAQVELSSKGDYQGALALVDAQLALGHVVEDPAEFSVAHYNRACFLSRLGRVEEALESVGWAVYTVPAHRADIMNDGDLEAARRHPRFEAVIEESLRRSFMGLPFTLKSVL